MTAQSNIITSGNPSHRWSNRPGDTKFDTLGQMTEFKDGVRSRSKSRVVSNRSLAAIPAPGAGDNRSLVIASRDDAHRTPTHWSFGQLAQLAGAPAGYLRKLPAPVAADCINYGLKFDRNVEEVGLLTYDNGGLELSAVTGPQYGRIWDVHVCRLIEKYFGSLELLDQSSPWQAVAMTASDRDMFVFMMDIEHPVEVSNRRHGETGLVYRGLMFWNSEVGKSSFGMATFLFDSFCENRTIFGVKDHEQVRIRHTVSAPDKFIEQVMPAIESYQNGATGGLEQTIANAQAAKIEQDLTTLLTERFGKSMSKSLATIHEVEEGRPIETLWDVSVAATAAARGITHQDARVDLERKAGKVLDLVAA